MWLIDLHDIRVGKANPDVFEDKSYAIGWNDAIQAIIETSPAIDPESLPIVQQLRKELERVTTERNAAVSNLGTMGVGLCKFCKHADGIFCNCEEQCIDKNQWKWRGIREV